MRLTGAITVLLAAASLLAAAGAAAQSPSSKPVSLVVPFAPGGGHDSMARILSGRLKP